MSQLLPPPFDHVTVGNVVDTLSHLLVIWGGVALFIVIGLRWLRKDPQPTPRQWLRLCASSILVLYALFTVFNLLPVSAYGRLTSVGLLESLRLAVFPVAYLVGAFALPQIILRGGAKVLAVVRRQRQR